MLSKKKWIVSFLFVILFILLTRLENEQVLTTNYSQTLLGPQQPNEVYKKVVTWFEQSDERVSVSAPLSNPPLIEYKSIRPYDEGAILSINESQDLYAAEDGLIIFTGYTRLTGKTLSILYESGETATFGFVEEFHQLPYTTIDAGEIFATADGELLFIKVEKDGEMYKTNDIISWLSALDE